MDPRTPAGGINLRLVLAIYAGAAALGGFLLMTNPQPLENLLRVSANGAQSLIFVLASIAAGAGLAGLGIASIDHPLDRRRAFGWFAAGHIVVLVMLLVQRRGVWPAGFADRLVSTWVVVTCCLFYTWRAAFGDARSSRKRLASGAVAGARTPREQLRSHLEQQVRLAAAQEERHRLARDLHDAIKQQIFAVQTAAATAEAHLGVDATEARTAIAIVRQAAREAMTEMDAMTDSLRAVPLENSGLKQAIRQQADALAFRTGADVRVHIGPWPPDQALAPGAQQTVFRVLQEALSNVARHARATRVAISLDATAGELRLVVADDGRGLWTAEPANGDGIRSMRARAKEYDGRLEIAAGAIGGTEVRFALPYSEESAQSYLHSAIMTGVGMALLAAFVALRPAHGSWNWWLLLIIPTAELLRYANAWWRTRTLSAQGA